jgi:hypothetical protein
MAFNRRTFHRNKCLARARRAIAEAKALRDGTHELCKVLTPERVAQQLALAVGDARLYRMLTKVQ